jgi:hypothetical protein
MESTACSATCCSARVVKERSPVSRGMKASTASRASVGAATGEGGPAKLSSRMLRAPWERAVTSS